MNKDIDYMKIAVMGYVAHRDHLSDYFFRNWKEAEKNHFSITEFFGGLRSTVLFLNAEIDRGYIPARSILQSIEDYGLPMIYFAQGRYNGHFYKSDLYNIAIAIAEAEKKEMDLRGATLIADIDKNKSEVIKLLEMVEKNNNSYLTQREKEIHQMIYKGYSYKEIAEHIKRTPETVKKIVEKICKKYGIPTNREKLASLYKQ